ncbi:MAG: hypothetical protein NZL89_03420 [Leptospiraceae bacterium]|nr:hypothetical protein [Leptospiraceae bacterium]
MFLSQEAGWSGILVLWLLAAHYQSRDKNLWDLGYQMLMASFSHVILGMNFQRYEKAENFSLKDLENFIYDLEAIKQQILAQDLFIKCLENEYKKSLT